MGRLIDINRGTSEYQMIIDYTNEKFDFNTIVSNVETVNKKITQNPISEAIIGSYRKADARVLAFSDNETIELLKNCGKQIPSFTGAGPRKYLTFNPHSVKAAIITTGGIAPGLHSVIHAIVQRHTNVYKMNGNENGHIYGIKDGFRGLCREGQELIELTPKITESWLSLGGSQLGSVRYYPQPNSGDSTSSEESQKYLAATVAKRLKSLGIDILYILGGDGSMRIAHQIAQLTQDKSIACVPKTMDNDILWVWESFGFSTAVEEASKIINTLHNEAISTRRICIIELFGAESGFVAANASLASGQVDLVLIPEVFRVLAQVPNACEKYWDACIEHITTKVKTLLGDPHVVIVIAQGVSKVLEAFDISIHGVKVENSNDLIALFTEQLKNVKTINGDEVQLFENQPKHNIRAVPANAHDQIFCERLGALIVDNALAGYTDFMVSQWMTEYVLIPLTLPIAGQKSIPLEGVFWKQVTNITGQPSHEAVLQEIVDN